MMSWLVSSNIVFCGQYNHFTNIIKFSEKILIAKCVLAVKKERADREKESGMMKERIDNERKEIQISVDKVILRAKYYVVHSKIFFNSSHNTM